VLRIRGASRIRTISLDDFSLLIIYAAAKGKPPAIALNRPLIKMSAIWSKKLPIIISGTAIAR
jgi:hypothetical protein